MIFVILVTATVLAFIAFHIGCMVRPLYPEHKSIASLLGGCVLGLTLVVYAVNGNPHLADLAPASIDTSSSLINQALILSKTNPNKAYFLLNEALLHTQNQSQINLINLIAQSIKDSEVNR